MNENAKKKRVPKISTREGGGTYKKKASKLAVGGTSGGEDAAPALGGGAHEGVLRALAHARASLAGGDARDIRGERRGALRVARVALGEGEGTGAELADVGDDDGKELDALGEAPRGREGLANGGEQRVVLALGRLSADDGRR